ncbi:hypothetical protein NC651_026703 [Populus alba x Populus x berolinensis]|nr:hypothetical protein NC651_026703 [Populus alba x Populus x berolinensis]
MDEEEDVGCHREYYRSFHINCGGQDVKNGKILYEGDQDSGSNAASRSYYRSGSNWGFSSTEDFMVVSMLEGQTSIPEVTSDPSIYGDDLYSKRVKGHYQQVTDQSLNNTQDLFPPSDKSWIGNSSTSAPDLYLINPKSVSLNLRETSSLI